MTEFQAILLFSDGCHQKVQKHFWHNLLHWQINGFDVRVGNLHLAEQNSAIVVVSRDQEPCMSLFLCLESQTGTSVFNRGGFSLHWLRSQSRAKTCTWIRGLPCTLPRGARLASHRSENWLIPPHWQGGLLLWQRYFFWEVVWIYQLFNNFISVSAVFSDPQCHFHNASWRQTLLSYLETGMAEKTEQGPSHTDLTGSQFLIMGILVTGGENPTLLD